MSRHSTPLLRVRRPFAIPLHARRLMLVSTLALMLLPAGCTATGQQGNEPSRQARFFTPVQMQPQEPSPRAELIFAQLKLDRALATNDREALLDAADRLMRFSTGPLPSSAPLVDAAIWLLAHEHEADAMPLILKASEKMPDDLALVSLRADLLIQHNERDKAITLLRDFAEKHPKDGQAQAELALALLRSGQNDEAMTVFRRIPEKQLNPQIRFAYAQALNVSGRFTEAQKQLEISVKEDPEYSEAWQLLALTLEELGNRAKAGTIYRKLLENDPENRSARLFLIRLLLQDGRTESVISTVAESQDPVQFAVAAAAILVDEKKLDQADRFFERLEQQKDMPDGLYFYHAALLYESNTDEARALSLLDNVSSRSPEYDKALRMKVRILYEKKRFSEALDTLTEMRLLHPSDVEPLLLTAELYGARKDFKAAGKAIDEALRLQPDNEHAAFQHAYLEEMRGNRAEAMKLMEAFIVKFPDNALALNYVGYNLADENRELDRAYALIRRAVELAPDADFILDSLAWVHFRRGELDAAWEEINRALDASDKNNPHDPAMLEHYGDIAAARGDVASARQGWKNAMDLFSNMGYEEDAARVRLKLEKL